MKLTAAVRLTTVTLDMNDAIELSQMLDYLAGLLRTSSTGPADLPRLLTAYSRLLMFGEAATEHDDGLSLDEHMESQW